MSSLMKKMIGSMGKKSRAQVLADSDYFDKDVIATTRVPINNVMLSGRLDGGITPGITQVIGDSRTFKSSFCAMQVAEFLDVHKDAVCLFFDSEFGSSKLFKVYGADESRILHIPFENIEELEFSLVPAIHGLDKDEKVIIYIDSVSQAASKKEMEDALTGHSARDMTRAQTMNSLFRIITPMLTIRGIPLFVINSFYDPIGNPYAEKVVKGGKQIFLSSDTILFVTRSQDKEGTELVGWNFNYVTMKSRFVKEKEKFTINVRYDGGIDPYSGLFELALEGGFIEAPKQGWYVLTEKSGIPSDKNIRRRDINDEVYRHLINNQDFKDFVHKKYALDQGVMLNVHKEGEVDPETGEIL